MFVHEALKLTSLNDVFNLQIEEFDFEESAVVDHFLHRRRHHQAKQKQNV